MKLKLLIDGEDKRVCLIPETEADKKILEFVNECDSAELITKFSSEYSDRKIRQIDLKMFVAPVEPN